ncbi:Ribosomal protein S18 [Nakaseomyces bracarensis]|uniref:Small ribosomal subunit protein bS18m n=1 Tax=Nakaseomyces bracarensis TaxID=273131 RepID=A0ABR4NWH9_9SACH
MFSRNSVSRVVGLVKQQQRWVVNISPKRKSVIDVDFDKKETSKSINSNFVPQFSRSSIYDPFDFSMARLNLNRKMNSPKMAHLDLFEKHGLNPLNFYARPEILSYYVGSTGKILHRDITGLSARNQRRMAKAIRRCQAIGLMSKTHRYTNFLD